MSTRSDWKIPVRSNSLWLAAVLLTTALTTSWAQDAPPGNAAPPTEPTRPADSPRPEQLEPGVNTSVVPPAAPDSTPSPAAPPKATGAAGSSKPAVAPASGATRAGGSAPGAPARPGRSGPKTPSEAPTAGAQPATGTRPAAGGGKAQDRIELDTTQITGNRELPKVLYIVPWKRSDLGDLMGKPPNSLLDEVLAPVDRDVFKRENRYYDALKPDGGPAAGAAVPGDKH
jgi:hypothetical protein